MIKKIFITVNYGTSFLLEKWASNIRCKCDNAKLIVVDNYKSDDERRLMIKKCKQLNIDLILSENVALFHLRVGECFHAAK